MDATCPKCSHSLSISREYAACPAPMVVTYNQVFACGCECGKVERTCSDCDSYTLIRKMTIKHDGRVICKPCQSKVKRITADRAQAALFDDQLSMF